MQKQILLQIIEGNFDQGFSFLLQIRKKGKSVQFNYQGRLPENTELIPAYEQWKHHYYLSPMIRFSGIRNPRIQLLDDLTEVISEEDYVNSQRNLQNTMEKWLNSQEIRDIKEHILDEVYKDELAQLVISTNNSELQRLPWQTWNLFERRPLIEVSFSSGNFSC